MLFLSICWRFAIGGRFLPRDAVLARYMLSSCLTVCPSHGGIVLKRLDGLSRFWQQSFFRPLSNCVIRKFGYLQKLGYFAPNSGLRKFRHGNTRRLCNLCCCSAILIELTHCVVRSMLICWQKLAALSSCAWLFAMWTCKACFATVFFCFTYYRLAAWRSG